MPRYVADGVGLEHLVRPRVIVGLRRLVGEARRLAGLLAGRWDKVI